MKLKRGDIKMKIEEQVLSREQMKHLQELGVDTSDASMVWVKQDSTLLPDNIKELWLVDTYHDFLKPMVEQEDSDFVQTYTIGDLIEKLPVSINRIQERKILIEGEYTEVRYTNGGDYCPLFYSRSLFIDLLYNLLCELAKNHKELLKTKK